MSAADATASGAAMFSSELCWAPLLKAHVYVPLCAKPAMLELLREKPGILEQALRECMDVGGGGLRGARLVVMIADGEVMYQAALATIGRKALEADVARQARKTAEIAAEIAELVDATLGKLRNESEAYARRLAGTVHWGDVAAGPLFQENLSMLEGLLRLTADGASAAGLDGAAIDGAEQVQVHVKTLIKNLFTQRCAKVGVTSPFTGNGLEMRGGAKSERRYGHLERACLLELTCIMTGIESRGELFTEMQYLNQDPQGMTHIATCIEGIRRALAGMPAHPLYAGLQAAAAQRHGLHLVTHTPPPEGDKLSATDSTGSGSDMALDGSSTEIESFRSI
jgi:hypothetical protein